MKNRKIQFPCGFFYGKFIKKRYKQTAFAVKPQNPAQPVETITGYACGCMEMPLTDRRKSAHRCANFSSVRII